LKKPTGKVLSIIVSAPVARLATVGNWRPYLVPVVFVFDGKKFFIPLDEKRKRIESDRLRRVKNIRKNPNVALLIDDYSDDWSKLFFITVQGMAAVIDDKHERLLARIHRLLRKKYPQYKKTGIGRSCISVDPKKLVYWENK
jgi:PPOX class probable F420-dependent enzyme